MTKLNNTVNYVYMWPNVYTLLYFDTSHLALFSLFMLSFLCADAANDSFNMCMKIPCLNVKYQFMFFAYSVAFSDL